MISWGFPSQFHRKNFEPPFSSQLLGTKGQLFSLDWFKGKFTGNHRKPWFFTTKYRGFLYIFPSSNSMIFHQCCFHHILIIPQFSYVSIPSYYDTIWSVLSLTSIRASSWANSKFPIPNVFNPLSLPVLLTPSWRPPAIMRGFGTGSLKLLHAFKTERWNSNEVDNNPYGFVWK